MLKPHQGMTFEVWEELRKLVECSCPLIRRACPALLFGWPRGSDFKLSITGSINRLLMFWWFMKVLSGPQVTVVVRGISIGWWTCQAGVCVCVRATMIWGSPAWDYSARYSSYVPMLETRAWFQLVTMVLTFCGWSFQRGNVIPISSCQSSIRSSWCPNTLRHFHKKKKTEDKTKTSYNI